MVLLKLIFIGFISMSLLMYSFEHQSQPRDPQVLQFDFTGQYGVEEYAEMVVLSCCKVTMIGLFVQTVVSLPSSPAFV